jgi:hypothetical protein
MYSEGFIPCLRAASVTRSRSSRENATDTTARAALTGGCTSPSSSQLFGSWSSLSKPTDNQLLRCFAQPRGHRPPGDRVMGPLDLDSDTLSIRPSLPAPHLPRACEGPEHISSHRLSDLVGHHIDDLGALGRRDPPGRAVQFSPQCAAESSLPLLQWLASCRQSSPVLRQPR